MHWLFFRLLPVYAVLEKGLSFVSTLEKLWGVVILPLALGQVLYDAVPDTV